jgi:hypothetical protein
MSANKPEAESLTPEYLRQLCEKWRVKKFLYDINELGHGPDGLGVGSRTTIYEFIHLDWLDTVKIGTHRRVTGNSLALLLERLERTGGKLSQSPNPKAARVGVTEPNTLTSGKPLVPSDTVSLPDLVERGREAPRLDATGKERRDRRLREKSRAKPEQQPEAEKAGGALRHEVTENARRRPDARDVALANAQRGATSRARAQTPPDLSGFDFEMESEA